MCENSATHWAAPLCLTLFPMMPQERRRWQTEVEEKRRQLEEDKRALQHLKVNTEPLQVALWFH